MNILILDDDIDKGNLIAEKIKLPGINIDIFDEYEKALNSKEIYNLLIVDICLGKKKNGSDFIRDYCSIHGEIAVEPYSGNPDIMDTMGYNVNEFDPIIFPAYLRSRIKQIQDTKISNEKILDRIGIPMVTTENKRCNDCVTDAGKQLMEIRENQRNQAEILNRIEKSLVGTLDSPGILTKFDRRLEDVEREQKISKGWQAEKDLIIRNFVGKALLIVIPTIVVIFSALFAFFKLFIK